MPELMTLEQLEEHIRGMPDDEILSVVFEEDGYGGDEEV